MQNNKKIQFVAVCFHNFDTISKKLILTRFNDPAYSIEVVVEPIDADVCLFNQETPLEVDELNTLSERLGEVDIPLIVLTETAHRADGELYKNIIKSPGNRNLSEYLQKLKNVFYQELTAKLERKRKQNPAKLIYNTHLSNAINPDQIKFENNRFYAQKYVGLNPDIDFDDEEALKKIQLNPKNYFFYYLGQGFELSRKKRKIACVKTVYGTFYVNAKDKLIYHEKTAEEIFNIHKIPFYKDSKVTIQKLKRNQLKPLNQFDYEPFVWLSSINASKGKIPQAVNFSAPVKLTAWPDLTKLIVFKHAIRIISLWSRGVYSVKHTGRLLNIPQRYPLTVYTAMHALGLITEVKKR